MQHARGVQRGVGQFSRPLPLLWPPRAPACAPPRSPPPFATCARWGYAFPPFVRGGMRERYVPPLYPLAPTHSNRTWVRGSPLSPAPRPPSPSFPQAKHPHFHLYPHPVCSRRGCKDGPPHGRRARDRTRPVAARPPATLPALKARARPGGGGGRGAAWQWGACGP